MRILFVCTGNICRSAAAKYILKAKLKIEGIANVEVSSAATYDQRGIERDRYIGALLATKGYDFGGRSVLMTEEMVRDANVVLGFSNNHIAKLTTLTSMPQKALLFSQYCFGTSEEIEDPFFQTGFVYRRVIDIIERG